MKTLRLPVNDWIRAFRSADYNTQGMVCGLVLLFGLSIVLRLSVIKAQTGDYINYVHPWLQFLKAHGLYSFHYDFANYNTPYLILLWLGNLTHLPSIVIVKGISIIFDVIMAAAVCLVVGYYRPAGFTKYIAGVTVMYLPTVYINSSLWGQCDSIYTSFLLFSFYACLKNRANLAWLWWGIALAFKLQAIFFLPFLLFITLHRRWKVWSIVFAAGALGVFSVLPIFEGRSVASTLSIYLNQTKLPIGNPMLSVNAPTLYQWLPNNYFTTYFKRAGTIFAAGVALAIVMLAFRDRKYGKTGLLAVVCFSLFVMPFCLPLMHERYFYNAEVFSLILAFVIPRLVYVTVAIQVVTVMAYVPYLTWSTQVPPLSYKVLSLAVLAIIMVLGRQILSERWLTVAIDSTNKANRVR